MPAPNALSITTESSEAIVVSTRSDPYMNSVVIDYRDAQNHTLKEIPSSIVTKTSKGAQYRKLLALTAPGKMIRYHFKILTCGRLYLLHTVLP